MKKILDLLEQKVQWIVLLAGVGYVLYMAWAYVVNPPVKATVAGEELPPGAIDKKVLETVGEQLQAKMNETRMPSVVPKPVQYVEAFKADMSYGGVRPEPNANALVFLKNGKLNFAQILNMPAPGADPVAPAPPSPGEPPGSTPPAMATSDGPVEKLPVPAAPRITVAPRTGMSSVNSRPPVGGAAPPAGEAVAAVDKSWVTVLFEFDIEPLVKQWADLKIPPTAASTSILSVTLTRQELMPDGTWGDERVIPTLAFHEIPQFPAPSEPAAAQYTYLRWAQQRTQQILQPAFYPVIQGDAWYIPGDEAPAQQAAPAVAFRPEQYVDAPYEELMKLTPDQRRAVAAYRQQQRDQNRGGGRRGAPAARPGPAASPEADLAPNDPGRPIYYQVVPEDVADPLEAIENAEAAPRLPGVTVEKSGQGKYLFPKGEFDPRKWQVGGVAQPVVGWAHDETARPESTYRYKVSYRLKNPVFDNRPAVKNPELVNILSIQSPDSEWSSPVDVASTVSFFIAGTPRETTGTVAMQVFSMKGGQPHTKTFNVSPGDVVGGVDGEVNYGTGWTVVDFVRNPASTDWIVMLMDSRGTVRYRTVETDRKDGRYQRLKEQAAAAPAASAAP